MSMKRRTYLAITGLVGTTGLAGCYLASTDDEESQSKSKSQSQNTTADDGENDNEQDNDEESLLGSSDDEENSEGGDTTTTPNGEENESQAPQNGNESNNDSTENEKPLRPEETEPDREKYHGEESAGATGMAETESLPESAVSVSTTVTGSDPSFTVEGSVTNESDGHIDFVDIEIAWLDENKDTLGTSVGVVQDIPPGESEDFRVSATTKELGGTPSGIRGTAYPNRYVS